MSKKSWIIVVVAFLLNIVLQVSSLKPQTVCWYEVASLFESGVKHFSPADIDVSLCSTIIYSNAVVNDNYQLFPRYPDNEITKGHIKGVYHQITALKKERPDLQVFLSIGNEANTQQQFNTMAANESLRKAFAASVTPMLDEHGFDGLDIAWSFPFEGTGNIDQDKQDFFELLKELRTSLDHHKLTVTLFRSEGNYDFVKIAQLTDMLNLRFYYGQCGVKTCHLSTPKSTANNYVETQIQEWIRAGVPPLKLNLGMAFFAERRKLTSTCKGLGSPATRVGLESYGPVCREIKEREYTVMRIEATGLPFAYTETDWIGYEDPVSAQKFARLVIKYNLAGILIWSLHADDFDGICGEESYPLLKTIKRTFDNHSENTFENRPHLDMNLSIILLCMSFLLVTLLSCVLCLRYQVANKVTHITLDVQSKDTMMNKL